MGEAWSIRRAKPDDARELARAERVCFSDPWTESGIRETLQDVTVVGLLASRSGDLAGYLLARTIAGEAEILNLAVLPSHRRRGLGRALLDAGLVALGEAGAWVVFLEVRESNQAAKNLYLGAGFRPVGLRADYYRRPKEDALILRRELNQGMR